MTRFPIVWQRLVSGDDKTCPRCDATHRQIQSAIAKLKDILKPLHLEPTLEVRQIDERQFRDQPSESNRIWIAGRPMEDWLGAAVGSSRCCSVCGDTPCRTIEADGTVFEQIPEELILKAALIAAAETIT